MQSLFLHIMNMWSFLWFVSLEGHGMHGIYASIKTAMLAFFKTKIMCFILTCALQYEKGGYLQYRLYT